MPLIDFYPAWMRESPEFTALMETYDSLVSERNALWTELLLQCNLDTATWGLALWEDRLSLPSDESQSAALRRAKIRARLQGGGIANAAALAALATSIIGQPVQAVEHNKDGWVEFLWGHPGYPENYSEMLAAIYEFIPAHLEPKLTPYWARWIDIHTGQLTMGQWNDMIWTQTHCYESNTKEDE